METIILTVSSESSFFALLVVPDNFTMMYNATRYEVTVEVIENVPVGTDLFTFAFFVNNNTLTDSFGIGGTVAFTLFAEGETNFQFTSNGGIGDVIAGLHTEEFNVVVFTVEAGNDIAVGFYRGEILTDPIGLDQTPVVNFTVNVSGKRSIIF